MSEHSNLKAKWVDAGREPQCPPDPDFPNGMEIDGSGGAKVFCEVVLPYPAPRCGYYLLTCDVCDFQGIVTTAGRPDDPRSVKIACKPLEGVVH